MLLQVLRASAEVDAPPEICAAFEIIQLNGRVTLKQSDALARAMKRENQHSFVLRYVKDLHVPGAKPREWVARVIWKWLDEHTLVVSYSSTEHELYPELSKFARAAVNVQNVYRKASEQAPTEVTCAQQIELKLLVPKWILKRTALGQLK